VEGAIFRIEGQHKQSSISYAVLGSARDWSLMYFILREEKMGLSVERR
jgi:hypothetical protein